LVAVTVKVTHNSCGKNKDRIQSLLYFRRLREEKGNVKSFKNIFLVGMNKFINDYVRMNKVQSKFYFSYDFIVQILLFFKSDASLKKFKNDPIQLNVKQKQIIK
jgi:hypothetical protein